MRISLLSHTIKPYTTIVRAIRECYKSEMNSSDNKALFLHILKREESPLEHASWTFKIEDISRVCSHQLVRHRMASYSQQSQRYVKQKHGYVTPQAFNHEATVIYNKFMATAIDTYNQLIDAGVRKEDARYVLPSGWKTSIVMTMNLRSFCNLVRLRCSRQAQQEIRDLATMLITVIAATLPIEIVSEFIDIMKDKANVKSL